MISLDQALNKPEVKDIWDGGTVVIRLGGVVVFRIQYNYHVSVDRIPLLDEDKEEFTDAIYDYNVISVQVLDDLVILDITKKENRI